jgi:hypothetical protein
MREIHIKSKTAVVFCCSVTIQEEHRLISNNVGLFVQERFLRRLQMEIARLFLPPI